MSDSKENLYKASGVDTHTGDALVEWLQAKRQIFSHPAALGSVVDGIGGFAGLFSVDFTRFKKPTLVASTDGVGTKLLLGLDSDHYENLGQDLVAMCVNDLYTAGAVPLFFLDYYATGSLDATQFKRILSSIQSSCRDCEMALLGGETAEMPGLYSKGHFDLAGFVVGVVDHENRLGAHLVEIGDVVIAFESSGFHSNGYSLIRKWLKEKPQPSLIPKLMTPTKLYHTVPKLLQHHRPSIHALANITGGGISGNLPRVLKNNQKAVINFELLPTPLWMKQFINLNNASLNDVEPVFNLGVGMMAIVSPKNLQTLITDANELGLQAHIVGDIQPTAGESHVDFI